MSLDAMQIILRANQTMTVEQLELLRDAANLARLNALEEAAAAVESLPRTYDRIKEDHDILGMKGTWTLTLNTGPAECAAAIRALKAKP